MQQETKEKLIFLGLCFFIVLTVYSRTIFGDFVFDDRGIVEHREDLQFTRLPLILAMPYWTEEAGLYRPIVLVSYSLNYALFGSGPWSFHLINLILYALSGYFVFLLVKQIFGRKLLAYLTSLLFLVLPIHTEAVANIIGRAEILALFFSLLALRELIKEKPSLFFVGFWFALALGSKETAIAVLPIGLLVTAIKERGFFKKEIIQKYWDSFLAFLVGGLVYFLTRFLVLGPQYFLHTETSIVENPLKFVSPLVRAATAFKILLTIYLKKSFWPFGFCSDYSYDQIPVVANFFNAATLVGLVAFLILTIGAFVLLKRRPVLALGCAFFVFGFLLTANLFFPTGTIAGERLAYFPSVGLCLFLAEGLLALPWLRPKLFFNLAFLIIGLSLFGFYGWRSFIRAADWLTEKRLFASAAICAPNSVLSRSNLGATYYLEGNLVEAKKELLASQQIYDGYPKGINNLGLVYWKEGDRQKAREHFLRALSFRFPYYGAYENLALMALEDKKFDEAREWLLKFYSDNERAVEAYIKSYQLNKDKP